MKSNAHDGELISSNTLQSLFILPYSNIRKVYSSYPTPTFVAFREGFGMYTMELIYEVSNRTHLVSISDLIFNYICYSYFVIYILLM